MGRVASGTGLISGINYGQLINGLLSVDSQPLTNLQTAVQNLQTQRDAYSTLQSQLSPLQTLATNLKSTSTTGARTVQTSNSNVLTARATAGASLSSYQLLAVRQASTLQYLSAGFSDTNSTAVGAGTITVKQGGFVSTSTSLSQLNGGAGVARGRISVTDRSGGTAQVDLSAAQTVSDVVSAINTASGVRVRASLQGSSIVLSDTSGGSGTLSVQDLGSGTTAADLGLAKSASGATLTSTNVNKLSPSLQLSYLNDGNGVRRKAGVNDFQITTADGSTISVGLGSAATVQDVLTAINSASGNSGKVVAAISSDGTGLQLTDSTTGGGTLSVAAVNNSQAAADLGLTGSATTGGNVLNGGAVLAGLNSVLLKNLNGGAGVGTLGQVKLTDRSGATATVDFSSATSLNDIVNGINNSGLGLKAAVNSAGSGLQITDSTGSTAANLKIADVTGGTAAGLKITTDSAANSVNSGDLNLRYISENTQLSSLNNGRGVTSGKFVVTNSAGNSATIDLTGSSVKSLADVVQAINVSGIKVTAGINSTGDGLLLTDSAGGANQLQVSELGSTTASDLHIRGSGTTTIDGALTTKITVSSTDTLDTVVNNINASTAGLTASTNNDGTQTPYRLVLNSRTSGANGRVLIDTGSTGIQLTKTADAANALLGIGNNSNGAPSFLFSSSTNTFTQVASGLTVTLQGTSTQQQTLTVNSDTTPISNQLQSFVSYFNNVSSNLTSNLAYDTSKKTGGTLHGDPATIQLQTSLYNLVGYRPGIPGSSINSLADLGITFKDGQLSLDSNVLNTALQNNPSDVTSFLNDANVGFANKLNSVIDASANSVTGQLATQTRAINNQIDASTKREDELQTLLDAKKRQLTAQFNALETALSSLQTSASQISQLSSNITLATGTTSSSSSTK